MSKTKQATLFQSWGSKKAEKRPVEAAPSVTSNKSDDHDVIDLCAEFDDGDDDDELLLQAEETFSAGLHDAAGNHSNIHEHEYAGDISIGAEDYTASQHQAAEDLPGFDPCAGKLWIYPTNYPVRNYQFNIVQQALFKNTMVSLPTGLGKTFIGAVVMYNFYRWYPQGKVIFMAPTKPLVAQQIEACFNIMGIPQHHTAEMTGAMLPPKRKSSWHEKRVFFLTPQVLTNDLSRGSCPGAEVRCLVIDEAHKALGNHAYCQVVREIIKHTKNFRVLALSATPGSDIKAVQLVLSNLLISHIEIRMEESIDIKQYCHERKVDTVVVPLGEELTKIKDKYIQVMDAVVRRLKHYGVLYNRETTSFSKFLILKARESFRQNPPEQLQKSQFGMVEGDFAIAMSLYHGYELLQMQGSRSLYNFLQGVLSGDKSYGRTRSELMKNGDFIDLIEMLSEKYKVSNSETGEVKPLVIGHPKMVKLQEIILEHFNKFKGAATRVMIFSQYRDSVQEITNMLHCHQPMIKVMSFIGQASTSKTTKGFTQKEQLMVMKQFREGCYNTLVSTCVGEEGLDIGDVDLIICFDANKSPIRLVQRMGRTGRKREGRIVMLLTEGKEEQIYNQSQYSKKRIHTAILNSAKSLHFYQHCPRMIPDGFTPAVHKMHITVKETFIPDKKITLEKSSDQKPITQAMGEVAAWNKKCSEEVLTLEEYRELEPWLVPESEIPRLAPSSMASLPGKQESVPSGAILSLSEWLPWQTTLQETNQLEHSMESRHLVELMGFVQLQQSLDQDDDPYGLEMAAYLNHDDVLQPGQTDDTKGPMLRLFQAPSSDTKGANHPSKKVRRKRNGMVSKASRCSSAFQALEVLGKDLDNSSDDDLPAFDLGKKTLQTPVNPGKEPPDSTAGNLGIGKQLKRKRRHTSNQSVIDVLEDTDAVDFDNAATHLEICSSKKLKRPIFGAAKTFNEIKPELNTTNCDTIAKPSEVKKGCGEMLYRVPTPPPTDTLTDILSEYDNIETLDIDLVKLVKEWQKESQLGKFAMLLKKDNDLLSDSSLEDNSLVSKDEVRLKSDSDIIKDNISPCRIDIDAGVRSEVSDISVVDKNEEDSKHEPSSHEDSTSDIMLPFKSNDQIKEIPNISNERLMSPRLPNATDISSSSGESSPVFYKSQRKNTSSNGSSKRNITSSKADKVSVQSSDSWSCDGMDDSLFKGIKTQHVTEGRTLETQVTFTQAFDCLPSNSLGSNMDHNELEKKSTVSDVLRENDETYKRNTDRESSQMLSPYDHDSLGKTSFELTTQQVSITYDTDREEIEPVTDKTQSQTSDYSNMKTESTDSHSLSQLSQDRAQNCSSKNLINQTSSANNRKEVGKPPSDEDEDVDFPDFDLGFDIDDEIIPPSPQSQPTKVSRLSQIFTSGVNDRILEVKEGKPSMKTILETDDNQSEEERAACDISVKKKILFTDRKSAAKVTSQPIDSSEPINTDKAAVREVSACKETSSSNLKQPDHIDSTARRSSTVLDTSDQNRDYGKKDIKEQEKDDSQSDGTGDHLDSPNFDTSFALLDDDLDDWIDSGRNIPLVATEGKAERTLDFDLDDEDAGDTTSEVSANVVKTNIANNTTAECLKDSSIHIRDLSSRFFEDSFNSPSNTSKLVRAGTSGTSDWLRKSNTSTPIVGTHRKVQAVTPFRSFCETADAPNESDLDDCFVVRRTKKANKIDTSDFDDSFVVRRTNKANKIDTSDFDDSFVVRRTKKTNKIDTSDSESNEFLNQNNSRDKINKSSETKTKEQSHTKVQKCRFVDLSSSSADDDEDFDDSFLLTKNDYMGKKPEESKLSIISSDEFEEENTNQEQKSSKRKIASPVHKIKKSVKHKRPSNPFIEEEAELSEENSDGASSDEEDGSDLDKYDNSFIHDSQFSQATALNQTDMQAMYMKSVVSPVAKRGGYKLQFQSKHVDVFSQVPQEDDTHYMEDSFCVGSEEEEGSEDELDWLALGQEEEMLGEVTMLSSNASVLHTSRPRRRKTKTFMTSRQRDIHAGRLKALDKIRAKAVNKKIEKTAKDFSKTTESKSLVSKKNRIQILEESSDEEQGNVVEVSKLFSPVAKMTESNNKKRLRIMSSSDDDQDAAFESLGTKCDLTDRRKEEHLNENDLMTKIKPRTMSSKNLDTDMSCDSFLNRKSEKRFLVSDCHKSGKSPTDRVILVDSKELSGAQSIISDLRFKHNVNVSTAQLSSCDYLVSNRMAVDRMQWSEFSHGGNRARMIDRIQQLQRLYDKVCLVVEKDRVKPGEETSKVTNWSKYVDRTCAMLLRSPVIILFSENQSETADLLSDLCQVEQRKQMGITAPVDLNTERTNMVKFYTSLPNITYINALNLCEGFSSVKEFMSSSVQMIEEKGKMSKSRAAAVYNFIRRS